jgi:hypothetical protein
MAYEQKPGNGSAFKNSRKRPDSNDSDFSGSVMLPDGTMHWFDLWLKTRTNDDGEDERWVSFKIGKPKQSQGAGTGGGGTSLPSASPKRDMDDDIPF